MNMIAIFAVLCGVSLFCLTLFVALFLTYLKQGCARRPMVERRMLSRFPVQSRMFVSWQDKQGRRRSLKGRAVDISERGACLTAYRPVPRDSLVYIKATQCSLEGTASVRYCFRRGLRYLIGVELRGSLTKSMGVGA